MGLSLDRLVFDPASPSDGSKVGSYIFSGDDGTALGHVSDALKVSLTNASVAVTGTFFQATQPVSAVSLPLPTGAATAALQTQPGVDIGDVTINNASGGAAVNIQDGGNSITVDGTVSTLQAVYSSSAFGATSVTNAATKIIATNLASRKYVLIQNLGTKDMFYGPNNTVTTATGIRVAAGQSKEIPLWGPALDLYGITASGTADVRYEEAA